MIRNYDYSKLRGRIIEKLGTIKNYAKAINLSETSISNKLSNRIAFSQDEINISIQEHVLDIKPEEIKLYFFTQKVGKNTTNK